MIQKELGRLFRPATVLVVTALVAGCGCNSGSFTGEKSSCGSSSSSSQSSSSGGTSSTAAVKVGGLWSGTLSLDGATPIPFGGLVDETGDTAFVDGDGNIYRGQVSDGGSGGTATFKIYAANGNVLTATGTATVVERNSITATSVNSAGQTGAISLKFQSLYDTAPSLQDIAGTYTYSLPGNDVTISVGTDGTISGQDSNGCAESGATSIVDSRYNAYRIRATITCPSVNSVTVTGLGFYQAASGSTPATFTAEYDDGATFAVVATAKKSN